MTSPAVVLASGLSQNAGPIGLVVVVLLGVATALLIRNMDKRVKRLPKEFPPPPGRHAPGSDEP